MFATWNDLEGYWTFLVGNKETLNVLSGILSNVVRIMISKCGKYIGEEEEKPVKKITKLLKPRDTVGLNRDGRGVGRF